MTNVEVHDHVAGPGLMRALPLVGAALATALLATERAEDARTSAASVSRILYASDWSGTGQIYAVDPSGRRAPSS